jgi:hypothetical protein
MQLSSLNGSVDYPSTHIELGVYVQDIAQASENCFEITCDCTTFSFQAWDLQTYWRKVWLYDKKPCLFFVRASLSSKANIGILSSVKDVV